jgi:flavin reductase (DIM6/NTAB) family NADH-FMN oxidoreductase RutF
MYLHLIGAILPRPIAWVSTCSSAGQVNLAPFSFFSGVTARPASLVFSPVNRRDGSKKDTVLNIEQTGQFVVNVVPHGLAEQMNLTSAEFDYGVSELKRAGLEPEPAERVRPPRVRQSPIHFECELMQIVVVGEGPLAANLIIGRILLLHVAGCVLDRSGQIDPQKLDLIGRLGGASYTTTRQRFDLPRPRIDDA